MKGGKVHSIPWVKRQAKRIVKERGVAHHEALDLAVQELGFHNWKHFLSTAITTGAT